MNNPIPCFISDSDEARLWDAADTAEAMRAKQVEDYADVLIFKCKADGMADVLNRAYDMYDGDLLPNLMTEIANWTGSMESSHQRMKAMYNLLADELQKMAEKEFA